MAWLCNERIILRDYFAGVRVIFSEAVVFVILPGVVLVGNSDINFVGRTRIVTSGLILLCVCRTNDGGAKSHCNCNDGKQR